MRPHEKKIWKLFVCPLWTLDRYIVCNHSHIFHCVAFHHHQWEMASIRRLETYTYFCILYSSLALALALFSPNSVWKSWLDSNIFLHCDWYRGWTRIHSTAINMTINWTFQCFTFELEWRMAMTNILDVHKIYQALPDCVRLQQITNMTRKKISAFHNFEFK